MQDQIVCKAYSRVEGSRVKHSFVKGIQINIYNLTHTSCIRYLIAANQIEYMNNTAILQLFSM